MNDSDRADKTVSVMLLGFPAVQKTIISTLITLSRKRAITYSLSESADVFESDILLLDVHDKLVMENWAQLKDIVGDLPVLAIGETEAPGATNWLKRALLASSLLDTLDDITRSAGLESPAPETPVAPPPAAQDAAPAPAAPQARAPETAEPEAVEPDPVEPEVVEPQPVKHETTFRDAPMVEDAQPEPPVPPELLQASPQPALKTPVAERSTNDRINEPASPAPMPLPAAAGAAPEPVQEPVQIPPATAAPNAPVPEPQAPVAVPAAEPAVPSASVADAEAPDAKPAEALPVELVDDIDRDHDSLVLVVDDSLSVWTQMKICLDGVPADLDFVSTAEEALRLVERRKYSLVFMDVMLPGIDGYEACRKIKTTIGLKSTPVVMLTSKSAPANKVKGVLAGCNYYLTKPVAEAEVKAIVQRFMIVTERSAEVRV